MKRLFIKVADLKETCDITHELENLGVDTDQIHVYSHSNELLKKQHVHPANAFHVGNLFTIFGRGLVIGAAFIILLGCLFYFGLHSVASISGLGLFALIGFGLGFGFWISGLLGIEELKHFIEKYYTYVNEGHFLMIVNCTQAREQELAHFVKSHHGNIEISHPEKH